VSVLLLRILQFFTFKGELGYNEILNFIQNYECMKDDKTAVNISPLKLVKNIDDRLKLGLLHYYLPDADIRKLLDAAF